jgi:hypothetical protein
VPAGFTAMAEGRFSLFLLAGSSADHSWVPVAAL